MKINIEMNIDDFNEYQEYLKNRKELVNYLKQKIDEVEDYKYLSLGDKRIIVEFLKIFIMICIKKRSSHDY